MDIPSMQYITINFLFSYVLPLFYVIYYLEVTCRNWNDQFDNVPEFL